MSYKKSMLRLLELSTYKSKFNESNTSDDIDELISSHEEFNAEVMNYYRNKLGLSDIKKAHEHFFSEKRSREFLFSFQIKTPLTNNKSERVVKIIKNESFKIEIENNTVKLFEFAKKSDVTEIYQEVFNFKKNITPFNSDVNTFIDFINSKISRNQNKEAIIKDVYVESNEGTKLGKGVKSGNEQRKKYTLIFFNEIKENKYKEKTKIFTSDSVKFHHTLYVSFTKPEGKIKENDINYLKTSGFIKDEENKNPNETVYKREVDSNRKFNLIGDKESNNLFFREIGTTSNKLLYEIHTDATFTKGSFGKDYENNDIVYYQDYIGEGDYKPFDSKKIKDKNVFLKIIIHSRLNS